MGRFRIVTTGYSVEESEPERTRIELFDMVWWMQFRQLEPVHVAGR